MARRSVQRSLRLFGGMAALALPSAASAHVFGQMYTLPIPVWLYLFGAAASLVVSFVVVGFFVNLRAADLNFRVRDLGGYRLFAATARVINLLRAASVGALALSVIAGLVGTQDPYANVNMTLFWVVFLLGITYLVALFGDFYAVVNPWRVLVEWVEQRWPATFAGKKPYPQRLGYYPALVLYMFLIWFELLARASPRSLSIVLLAYTLINALGTWRWGKHAWLRYGELFSVFMRLIGMMAPFDVSRDTEGRRHLILRQPFIGLLRERAESRSQLLFVFFMLSSTAFDGLHETHVWLTVYWNYIFHAVGPAEGAETFARYADVLPYFKGMFPIYQAGTLLLSPYVYLGIYLAFVWLAKWMTRTQRSVGDLALDFGLCLIPIAFVYNVTHYFTLLLSQGPGIVRLLSDPFGFGWNLFHTRGWFSGGVLLDAAFIWHFQVALILVGHIVSVYLAHVAALRVFPSQRQATISQVPLLLLMVMFTTLGLWILSRPIASGQYFVPGGDTMYLGPNGAPKPRPATPNGVPIPNGIPVPKN